MPLDTAIDALGDEDEERLDAFLLRFNSLTAMVQDHVTRAILLSEEEDLKGRSKKDQRLLMEKLGALKPELNFGTLAELRNRIAHHYPDDSAKQAEILNEVFVRSNDLLNGYNTALTYADQKLAGASASGMPIPPWTRTGQSLARYSAPESFVHAPSLAGFTIIASGS
jgi:hypothetical protein